jgi:WD40 repeat protein
MKEFITYKNSEYMGFLKGQSSPFPGLRSFSIEESHLFFGREGQSDEVLDKLFRNKFVSIVGASGSGKSSFLFCGVIPILYGGFASAVGSNWHVVSTRPGATPIDNLSESLLLKDSNHVGVSDENKQLKKTITSTLLKSSSLGLIEAVKQLQLNNNYNVLIVVDQFEELFRFKRKEDKNTANESLAYINLLMEAVKDKDCRIYVALTMRSDFVGECAQFPELTKYINESHYLIPQMVREQKRLAIEGPLAVSDSAISARLVQQLLNDLGDNPDQLPIMQHALMRTWMYWQDNQDADEVMDLRHYEAVGSMVGALSQHADEAYDELTEKQKIYCEILFKNITEKGSDSAGIRRPTKLAELAAVAACTEEEMTAVIEHFRIEGRSLLTPSIGVALNGESMIDISHESLMRIWIRLKKWVEEENESAQMYLKLSEAASNYQIGKAGLWRQPDLQLALNWKKKNKPTLFWAQRYDSAFERTLVFLETSSEAYEEKIRLKEMAQRKSLNRARLVALVLGLFTVMALGSLVFSVFQTLEATKQKANALAQREVAIEERKEVQRQKEFAILASEEANIQREYAELNLDEAAKQRNRSLHYAIEVNKQNKIAAMQRELSLNSINGSKNKKHTENAKILSISESMATKSLRMNKDASLKALLALQAYRFYTDNEGTTNPSSLYESLYEAVKERNPGIYKTRTAHVGAVQSLVYAQDGKAFYSAGSDGRIYKWSESMSTKPVLLYSGKEPLNELSIAPSGNILAITNASSTVYLLNLTKTDNTLLTLKGHTKKVIFSSFLGSNKLVTASVDSTVRLWNISSGSSTTVYKDANGIRAIAIHSQDQIMAVSNFKGETRVISINNQFAPYILDRSTAVEAIQFSTDGAFVALSKGEGIIKLIDVEGRRLVATLIQADSRAHVFKMKFDRADSKLASCYEDGTIRIWDLHHLSESPIQIKMKRKDVLSIDFNEEGTKLIAGCTDNTIYTFAVSKELLADQLCGMIDRNMSAKEWEEYVSSKEIQYEKTCVNLPVGEGN